MISTLTFLLLVCALANWQMVETWHHGSIFDDWRAWVEAHEGFFVDLLGCPYCLSHWTAAALTTAAMALAQHVCAAPAIWWLITPAFALAVSRLSNVLNDITHSFCRTPRIDLSLAGEFDDIAKGAHEPTVGEDRTPHHP